MSSETTSWCDPRPSTWSQSTGAAEWHGGLGRECHQLLKDGDRLLFGFPASWGEKLGWCCKFLSYVRNPDPFTTAPVNREWVISNTNGRICTLFQLTKVLLSAEDQAGFWKFKCKIADVETVSGKWSRGAFSCEIVQFLHCFGECGVEIEICRYWGFWYYFWSLILFGYQFLRWRQYFRWFILFFLLD